MARYSQARIQLLLRQSDDAPTADEKGDKLEDLTRYLFEKVPGVSFEDKNILDGVRAHEIDLAFWNPPQESQLSFLDAILIIECKNHGTPVTSAQVGWFVRKLQDRGALTAVLVSLSGITGAADGQDNAYSEVLGALVRDGIKILVLSRAEILGLTRTNDLVRLLKRKHIELSLRRTVVLDNG